MKHNSISKHTHKEDRNPAKMARWRTSPPRKGQKEITARNLLKIDINRVLGQEFRATVIGLLPQHEKRIEHQRSHCYRDKDLKTHQVTIKKKCCN